MSNLIKRITSAIAGLSIIFSVVSPVAGVSAAYTSLEAANKLATFGVIVDQSSNPANYRLGDTISRKEMAKVTMNLSSSDVTNSCQEIFSDLPSSDWGCKYAEAGLSLGFFASNSEFRPNDDISKWEALKFIMQARGLEKGNDSDFRKAYVDAAVEAGIATYFSDYNTAITRGQIFIWAAEALELEEDDDDDLLSDLLGNLDPDDEDDEDMDDDKDTTDPFLPVVNTLTVSLSPETPGSSTVPKSVSGLPVARFDFTAGSEDVTVTSLTVKRRGLSDKDTLDSLAVFVDGIRGSKGRNDSLENNTEALLTLANQGLVIQAGETKTLTIVADTGDDDSIEGHEFAVELVSLVASSTFEREGFLVGNTMRISSLKATSIKIEGDGGVSDPKLGEQGADIFKFRIEGASDRDVILRSITFRASDGDAEDSLSNITLTQRSEVIAVADNGINNKYFTFDFGDDGIIIAEDKNERFTVTADIISGAGETFYFYIDRELDVSAIDDRNYGVSVDITGIDKGDDALEDITIEAGEIILSDMNAPRTKIRSDRNDVVLGSLDITNVAGKNLELQTFGIRVESDGHGLLNIFESFELYNEDSGSSYAIDLPSNTSIDANVGIYSDDDLSISLPQGTTTFSIRADTKQNVPEDTTIDLSLDANDTTNYFYVEEVQDSEQITDITPSSLKWTSLEFISSGVSVARIPIADISVVKGSEAVVMQFEIESSEASTIIVDEIEVLLRTASGSNPGPDFINGPTDASLELFDTDKNQVNQISLYKGSVTSTNLLGRVSGSSLNSGRAIIDFIGGPLEIDADSKEEFLVTVDIIDSDDVINKHIKAYFVGIDVEDDDGRDIYLSDDANTDGKLDNLLDSGRILGVQNVGEFTIVADPDNDANKNEKTILGGTSDIVFSVDVVATNEEIDVDTVKFIVDKDIRNSVKSASLYLEDELIETNSITDIKRVNPTNTASGYSITFEGLNDLIIPESSTELKLGINTQTIGYREVGETLNEIIVNKVEISEAKGVSSGENIDEIAVDIDSDNAKEFSIVPAILVASVEKSLSTGEARLKVTVDTGDNTASGSSASPSVRIDNFDFIENGNSTDGEDAYTIHLLNKSDKKGIIGDNDEGFNNDNGIDANDLIISGSKTYVIYSTDKTAGKTYSLKLKGITYSVTNVDNSDSLETNFSSELDLGQIRYSNSN